MKLIDNLVVIGASGLVGTEFINIIKNFELGNLILISNGTIGQICPITNKKYESIDSIDFTKKNIYINCANSDQAQFIKKNMSSESYLIDNSSEYRLDPNVLLCIPEINFSNLSNFNSNVISNPNCSTIILALLLNPFISSGIKINRVVVSTYQAASGAGKVGLEELEKQTEEIVFGQSISTNYWKQQFIHNTFIHDSPIEPNGYFKKKIS